MTNKMATVRHRKNDMAYIPVIVLNRMLISDKSRRDWGERKILSSSESTYRE